jgi:hypothetical protein
MSSATKKFGWFVLLYFFGLLAIGGLMGIAHWLVQLPNQIQTIFASSSRCR